MHIFYHVLSLKHSLPQEGQMFLTQDNHVPVFAPFLLTAVIHIRAFLIVSCQPLELSDDLPVLEMDRHKVSHHVAQIVALSKSVSVEYI